MIRLIQAGRIDEAGVVAGEAILAYRQLAGAAGADFLKLSAGLHELSGQLANAALPGQSAAASKVAADIEMPL